MGIFKLHHIGILCADTARSIDYYTQIMGHECLARFYNKGQLDLTFLGSGSELYLELIGPPFEGNEAVHFAQRGPGFHHLAFSVDDVDEAFATLTAAGLRVAWEPDDFLFVRHCGVYDNNGVVVEILQETMPLARPQRQSPIEFQLHHFDLFSHDWRATKAFYQRHFGLQSIFEYEYDHEGAFIYSAVAAE